MAALDLLTFLSQAQHKPVVDVRSPGEYAQGHLPGAVNLPLFSDAERAAVGTLYKNEGARPAMLLGLELVGKRMADLGRALLDLSAPSSGELLLHCWRGGQRSSSMAWLAQQVGVGAHVLRSGYKSFRRWAVEHPFDGHGIRVVAGLTGSGKTEVLHALAASGQAVLDLERLANHKGSAFGALGEAPQPTQEQFENALALAWHRLPEGRQVWLEDESRTIGKRFVPEALWQRKQNATYHVIGLPLEERLDHLVKVYGEHSRQSLLASVQAISKRLGGLRLAEATAALEAGDLHQVCRIVLAYYDRTYQASIDRLAEDKRHLHDFVQLDPSVIAARLAD